MAHYRTKMNFNWEALEGAETALKRLYALYLSLGEGPASTLSGGGGGEVHEEYHIKFKEYVSDDLDTPKALALLWDVAKDGNMSDADKKATILDFDKVLGLGFDKLKAEKIPKKILRLVEEREEARKNKDFKLSDEIREKINSLGYEVKDTDGGPKIFLR